MDNQLLSVSLTLSLTLSVSDLLCICLRVWITVWCQAASPQRPCGRWRRGQQRCGGVFLVCVNVRVWKCMCLTDAVHIPRIDREKERKKRVVFHWQDMGIGGKWDDCTQSWKLERFISSKKNRYQTIIIHSHLFSKLSKAKRSFDNYKLLHNTLKTQMRLQPQLILSPWMVTGCERTHLTHMHMKAKSVHWYEPLIELQGCLPGWQCALPNIREWKSLVVIWFSRHQARAESSFTFFSFFYSQDALANVG